MRAQLGEAGGGVPELGPAGEGVLDEGEPFELNTDDIDVALSSLIDVGDPVGIGPDTVGAHGSAFDRISAFTTGGKSSTFGMRWVSASDRTWAISEGSARICGAGDRISRVPAICWNRSASTNRCCAPGNTPTSCPAACASGC